MAQFDVHRRTAHSPIRYHVVVQSGQFSALPTRVVIPLMHAAVLMRVENRVAPGVVIEAHSLFINALQILTVPLAWLGPVVASLAEEAEAARIIGAIDEAISRGYR